MQTRATTRHWFSHHQRGRNFRASQCREWRESGETQALVHSVQTQVGTDLKERLVVSCEAGDTHALSPSSSVSRCVPKCFQQRCGVFLPHTGSPTQKDMAPHSSVLAWRIPGMGEPGGLLSVGSHRVGHD